MVLITIISSIVALCMALMVFFVRMRAANKPASVKKIILPPFFMSSGFLMFLYPGFHVPVEYAIIAFFVGMLFSYPLIITSRFEVVGKDVYLKRSKAFVFILLGLVVIRLVLKTYISQYINVMETGSLFFVLAFGMIVPWRIAMYFSYLRVQRELDDKTILT
ncbi:cytochrome c biogenesis protein CcdC [Aneurinibacillus sp. Ricciae_BoGa-3]|uniref:CcdC family protein n=1 Tax=Aneurinibacillus sp. Ricciae_BoGa-3 TaxID=3022697 RepID=UPI0023405C8A|nr:cytochrome c biogenesis protein CcdC [Aneurinibacillus sp. Ricciae_BoGa-3]WCK54004.1 cytochrome c biogenesis protein CcdC [Aneurinibacillus sp. Ricciae_BoGa-3]